MWSHLQKSVDLYVLYVLLGILGTIWRRLSRIDTEMRQQTRLLQTVLAAVQSSGADGNYELTDGVTLPAKSMQLLDSEKILKTEIAFSRSCACTCHCTLIH